VSEPGIPIDIQPGIFKEASGYASAGRWIDGSNVRFWKGLAEFIGGWVAIATACLVRPARGVQAYRSLGGTQLLAWGHARGVQLLQSGNFYDISPVGFATRKLSPVTLSANCTITIAAPGVVTCTAHGLLKGSSVRFTTTGALPTGLAVGTTYYVSPVTVDTFKLSTTQANAFAGTYITTTGTQSGTHTVASYLVFTSGEAVVSTDSTGATANGTGNLTSTSISPILVGIDAGQYYVTLTGVTGTFQPGETIRAAGGATAIIVSGTGSPLYVDYLNILTGTFTGIITGALSGATATISASSAIWDGRVVTGGSSGSAATISTSVDGGLVDSQITYAWGGSTWSTSTWGGAQSIYSVVSNCTTWTFANWGEDLIACPRGGGIYLHDTSVWGGAPLTRMGVIDANAPPSALGVFMNDQNRTLVAYGVPTQSSGVSWDATVDPLFIAWANQEDYSTWFARADNTAGTARCQDGSTIVGHMSCRGGFLISTDTSIYTFSYVGLPAVFKLDKIADGSSLVGPHAWAQLDNVTYWRSKTGFVKFDGTVLPLPCDVHQYINDRANPAEPHKWFCATNRKFHEVTWFYCSTNATEVDSSVTVNVLENTWWIGDVSRTSWTDASVVISYPVAAGTDRMIYAHENGTTANGAPISYTLETGDLEAGDGTDLLHGKKILPNYTRISGTHTVSIECRDWPNRAARTKGPFSLTATTEQIPVRSRGRTLRLLLAGTSDFRMGKWRFRATTHGKKA
jgi:hypothetical protein